MAKRGKRLYYCLPMKVFWFFSDNAYYPIRFFNLLGQAVDLTVVLPHAMQKERERAYGEGIKNFHVLCLKPYCLGGAHQVKTLFEKEHDDRIVLNGNGCSFEQHLMRILSHRNVSYLCAYAEGSKRDGKYLSSASQYLVADAQQKLELSKMQIAPDKIHLCHRSILLTSEALTEPLSEKGKSLLRQGLGLTGKKIYVSLHPYSEKKNNLTLIDRWKAMPKDSWLLLFEDGTCAKQYQERVKKHRLENIKLISGQKLDDVLKYLRIADAALFFSEEERFSCYLAATLSQGTPIFGNAKNPAVQNILQDGVNGYRVKEDTDLKSLLESPLPLSMNEAAIASAKPYTLETMVKETLDVLSL